MKKKNLKNLKLNKNIISSFNTRSIVGGESRLCNVESVIICEEEDNPSPTNPTFWSYCPCR